MSTIAQLRERIERLEGTDRRRRHAVPISKIIDKALPFNGLPTGCVHEIRSREPGCATAFAALLASRIPSDGSVLYAAPDRSLYPLGLLPYGVKLDRWLHVSARKPEDLIWTVSEAVRCRQIKAVLAVLPKTDLTFCRRLQLAAEASGTACFLLGNSTAQPAASAITRWRIASVNGPAGRGFDEAYWELELSYCRGCRPGKWMIAWKNGSLEPFHPVAKFPVRAMRDLPIPAAKAG